MVAARDDDRIWVFNNNKQNNGPNIRANFSLKYANNRRKMRSTVGFK
jgi:hypothetical protein